MSKYLIIVELTKKWVKKSQKIRIKNCMPKLTKFVSIFWPNVYIAMGLI